MITVLVVEDSAVLRQEMRLILQSDPELQVVGEACNGQEGFFLAKRLKPDVITMDLRMPKMDGLEAIRCIMAESPVPIVVVTSADSERDKGLTTEATKLGAVSVLKRPSRTFSSERQVFASRLIQQVKLMSQVRVIGRPWMARRAVPPQVAPPAPVEWAEPSQSPARVMAIGASTGGPAALYQVLGDLPVDLAVPVLVVQHISFGFVDGLASWLDGGCKLEVGVAQHGQRIEPGHVYLAPDAFHLAADRFGRLRLMDSDAVDGHRPSATVLFESVADAYGASAVAVILTGMGRDGATGMKTLKDAGAVTIAQDEKSCVVFGMPGEAIALGAIRHVVPLSKIGQTAAQFCSLRAGQG
ncbi:MAG: chemotaxis-specific protein-glutamate methyltransferase CheB [Chloroflexota bacterium]